MRGRIRIAIACTALLLGAPSHARTQTTFRETGSMTVGGYFVWVRSTNAKVVELFVNRGFRDAFAKAHDLDAATLQRWIDSVRAVAPASADDSTAMDAQVRGTPFGTDVTMLRRVGGTLSGLRLLVAGEEPIKMAEPTARDFIAILDSAARETRELSVPPPTIMAAMPIQLSAPARDSPVEAAAAAPVMVATRAAEPPPTITAPTPAPAPAPPPAPTMTPAPSTAAAPSIAAAPTPAPRVAATPTVTTSAMARKPAATSKAAATSKSAATRRASTSTKVVAAAPAPEPAPASAVALGPSTTEAAPELVLPGPAGAVTSIDSSPSLAPLPAPMIPPAPMRRIAASATVAKANPSAKSARPAATPARKTPAAQPSASDSAPDRAPQLVAHEAEAPVAAPVSATAVVAAPVVAAPVAAAPVAAPDTAAPPHVDVPADKLIRTPLGPFTIPGALLSDRDKQAQYCYTQLGLKYSPDLKGEITVKLSLRTDGGVQDAVVTKRSWQGISAGEVESCVRALAHDWTFASTDPSVAGGSKDLIFRFTP
jgi:hypothetical protein